MKFRNYAAILVTGAMLSGLVAPVLANELEEQHQQVQQQMQSQQNKAAQAQEKVNSVSGRLQGIQSDLETAQKEYKSIQAQLSQTESQIEANKVILVQAEGRLAERSKVLDKRIRDIYQNGQLSYLDVLLGASDFGDFTTRMDLLKRVINRDVELIVKVKAERQLVMQKKEELEQDRAVILELKRAADERKKIIEARRNEQKEMLNMAVGEKEIAEQAYNELMDTSRRIEQMLRNRQNGGGKKGPAVSSGSMMWPINGEITSPFGWRTHPVFGSARFHSGLDIAADYGDTVVAADGGVVVHADWLGGYGKAVIIEHSNGLQTLYGHNSELVVSEGQAVSKGQMIARAGSTGYSTGPHVHFEVRQGGSPVDPTGYLP
ncbi:murein hydrolase activator EnvC family protein [Azotosporobacter soli]|uniref:murein hydrolase activator EnvC family protein n=1 Tax=Azotosporobacter soli TaxID=3055040 RepID=UPI0031FE6567